MSAALEVPTVVYVHGAGRKPPVADLKEIWDWDLFGRDMGQRTQMFYYANLLQHDEGVLGIDSCTQEGQLAMLEVAEAEEAQLLERLPSDGQDFAIRLSIAMAARAASRLPNLNRSATATEPMPTAVYRQLLRQLLLHFVSDTVQYFFHPQPDGRAVWEEIQQMLRHTLVKVKGPLVVIGHDLGALIAYAVLSDPQLPEEIDVPLLVTLGSPLGYASARASPRRKPSAA